MTACRCEYPEPTVVRVNGICGQLLDHGATLKSLSRLAQQTQGLTVATGLHQRVGRGLNRGTIPRPQLEGPLRRLDRFVLTVLALEDV